MKLNFICPGASKSGTTTLHNVLKKHPDFVLPEIKETQFFVRKDFLDKGLDFYFSQYFPDLEGNSLIGEICPQYMSSVGVPEKLYGAFGRSLKIIFMLRYPIDRAYSHYLMKTRIFESKSFHDAITAALNFANSTDIQNESILKKHLEFNNFRDSRFNKSVQNSYRYSRYIYPGLYSTIIKDYLKFFPIENMHFIIFEEFIVDSKTVLTELFKFLDVEEIQNLTIPKSNSRKLYKSLFAKKIRNLSFLIPVNVKNNVSNIIGEEVYQQLKLKIEKPFVRVQQPPRIETKTVEVLKAIYQSEISELKSIISNDLKHWGKFE